MLAETPVAARPRGTPAHTCRRNGRAGGARRLRVLFLVDYARTIGGAERFVTGLASNLPPEEIEAWVCSTRHGDEHAVQALAAAGIPHLSLERTSTWQLHRFLPLIKLLRQKRFDVLHANMFGSNVWGTVIGRACGVPVVIAHEHNWSYRDDRRRLWIDRHLIARLATTFVTVCRASYERMVALEGIPARTLKVMPLPHIPHQQRPDRELRSELGLGSAAPLVAVAAEMRPEKALGVLVDAHALLLRRVPDAQLVIAGDGPCRAELEDQIERLGLGGSVHVLGVRRDVDAILRAADVGAMSSDWEGMPLFALECIAAGTPLVATDVGGMREIVNDGETGLLVPARDPAALAAVLERILTNRPLADRMARAAAARRGRFSVEAVAEQYVELYRELDAAARRSRGVC